MTFLRHLRTIRARLMFWNAAAIGAVLIVYSIGLYLFVREGLYEELDRQLEEDVRAAMDASFEEREPLASPSASQPQRTTDVAGGSSIEMRTRDGRVLYQRGPDLPTAGSSAPGVESIRHAAGEPLRVYADARVLGGDTVLVRAARSEEAVRHELAEILAAIGLGLPASVLLACLGGYFLAGKSLRPVGVMAARAKTITADRLSERLPVENPEDELGRLGTVFNDTLARLERSFDSLRRFTADAAHELRTPLTALRTVGEVALRDPRVAQLDREVVESMLEEAHRLTSMVDTLLLLARSDGNNVPVQRRLHDLREVVQEAIELVEPLAGEKNLRVVLNSSAAPVHAVVDRALVRQALLNILDNAIKYSPEGAEIRVAARSTPNGALVEVTDEGPGIASEHRERIFERFYRVDSARSRETGGAGLGLSIALWAIRANEGSIQVESDEGRGSNFRIFLPGGAAQASRV